MVWVVVFVEKVIAKLALENKQSTRGSDLIKGMIK